MIICVYIYLYVYAICLSGTTRGGSRCGPTAATERTSPHSNIMLYNRIEENTI